MISVSDFSVNSILLYDGVKESSVEKNETSPSIDVSRPDLSYILHLVGPFVK